jgi:hypothetical protein
MLQASHECAKPACIGPDAVLLLGRYPTTPMPAPRPLSIVLAVLVSAVAEIAAVTAQTSQEPAKAAQTPDIVFYLARGGPDSCGHGCNEWIGADGKIDLGAAQRLRRLLAKLGRRRPPIFLFSPGGAELGALELGRLFREQKLEVGVGYTIPRGCERDKPLDKACEALKHSGQELEAELDDTFVWCNSACVWALVGGASRFVPPGAKLGIHDVGFDPDKPPPRAAAAIEAKRLIHARMQEYLRDMGMDKALFTASAAVPFESARYIEREEIARFGIDRREFGETVWHFTGPPTAGIYKRFFVRAGTGDLARYRDGFVRMTCGTKREVSLSLLQERGSAQMSAALLPVAETGGQRIVLQGQTQSGKFDNRYAWISPEMFESVGHGANIRLSGIDQGRDDGLAGSITLNMGGFPSASEKLRQECDEAARIIEAAAKGPLKFANPAANSSPRQSAPAAQPPAISQNAPGKPVPPRQTVAKDATDSQGDPLQPSCMLQIADAPEHQTGRVVRFLPDEQALERTRALEALLEAKISPAYLSLKRVEVDTRPYGSTFMAAVPEQMAVQIGDMVELNSRHRDTSLPCHFIPSTINRLIEHAE